MNVATLSPEDRVRAEAIVFEKRRRKREERLRYFIPQRPPHGNDQLAFIMSPAKIRAAFGGNRSGKTEVAVVDALLYAVGRHPYRSRGRKPPVFLRFCAPKMQDNIVAVVHKKIKEMVPRHELLSGSWRNAYFAGERTLRFANGSEIRFFSYDQDRDAYGGADIDGFYMDEHAPKKLFEENIARTVDRDGYGVLTMTPEEGITWEEDDVIEASEFDDDIDYWYFSTYDNPHLSRKGIADLEKLITDPRLRDAKLLGRFVSLSGMVYPTFKREIHFIEPFTVPEHWHFQFIIDPHHRKPSRMIWRAINHDGESFTVQEAEFSPSQGGVPELATFIRVKSAAFERIDDWIIDEAMGGDGLNIFGKPSVGQGLNDEGIPVVSTNISSDKSFSAGILKVRSKLKIDPLTGKPTHSVFQTCRKTMKQYEKYSYRKKTKIDEELLREHVRNVNDDFVTCDRYGMMAELNYTKQNRIVEQEDNW